MATRIAARYVSRRLSSGGKIFSEEEKAAENIYIKSPEAEIQGLKTEQEKLEKLARKGPKAEESGSSTSSGGSTTSESSAAGEKKSNYAVIAGGVVVVAAAMGWFLNSSTSNKSEVEKN